MGDYPTALHCLGLLAFCMMGGSYTEPLYTLITPSIIRVDSVETIVVEAHDHSSPVDVLVTVHNFPQKTYILHNTKARLDRENGMLISAKIKIPAEKVKKESHRKQYVSIQATSPLFTLEKVVLLSFHTGYIFIQTDKTIYSPGSTVMYRLFTVGHSLDPRIKPVSVEIVNPDGIAVDRKLASSPDGSGIIPQSYKIPDISIIGTWKIVCKYEDGNQEGFATEFEVKEYVLPNFEVKLDSSQKYFFVDDNELIIDISARFLFDENVQGQAFVLFGVMMKHEKKSIPASLSKVPIQDGKGHAKLTRTMLQSKFPSINVLLGHSIYVSVTVLTNTGSDMVQAEKSGIYIVRSPYKITLPKASMYFKPGMPFGFMVSVRNPDGSPAPQVFVETVIPAGGSGVSQADGTAHLVVNTPSGASQLYVKVKTAVNNLDESRQSSAFWTAAAYKTPDESGNYLHLSVPTSELKSGDTISVYFNLKTGDPAAESQIQYFTYLILSKGKVLRAGRQPRQTGQNYVIMSLLITPDLIPSFRIVAYYKIGNSEIVADSIWVDVKDTCMGTLEISGAAEQDNRVHEPQAKITLKIRGDPGARVGLVAVDKAVYVLNKKSKLSQSKIWNTVEKSDIGCTAGGGRDNAGVFVDAGLGLRTSSGLVTDTNCGFQHRRRRSLVILEKKRAKAQEYLIQFHRKCCEDGMEENPMGYSCERRSNYILEGRECIKAFLDCCNHIFGSSLKKEFAPGHYSNSSSAVIFENMPILDIVDISGARLSSSKIFMLATSKIEELERVRDEDKEVTDGEEDEEEEEDNYEAEYVTRFQFAESWMWMQKTLPQEADFNGLSSEEVSVFLKDSITTWEVLAVSLSQTKGICVADPYEIMVKKNFFIDLRLPYSIVRNEQVAIKAVLYNYVEQTLKVWVELVHNEKMCSFSSRTKQFRQQVTIHGGTSQDITYVIIPLEVGELEIEVKAIVRGALVTDAVRKKLLVVPEGMKIFKNVKSVLLDPKGQGSASGEQRVEVDPVDLSNVVPNTEPMTLISVTGDIVGETIENSIDGANLKHLIRIPSGCGEQNMIGLTPAVIATHYLDNTHQWERIGVDRRAEAINVINKGYTQQLAYRKKDHSYAAFQNRPSSTWLTGYVVKVFAMTYPLIHIEDQVLCGAVKWLIQSKQKPDGTFKEDAPVIHGEMVGGSQDYEPEASLTAFVVIALHEAKAICQTHVQNLESSLREAGNYLARKLESLQKSYSVAITSYALSLLGRDVAATKLMALSAEGTHWPDPKSKLHSIEATSYGLLALLQQKKFDLASPIVRWLTEQRFYGGGYGSTQATIMVFQALAKHELSIPKNTDEFLQVSIELPSRSDFIRWQISYENAIVPRTMQTKATGGFTVSARGTGKGTLSVMTVYYAHLTEGMAPCEKFDLTVSVEKLSGDKKPEGALGCVDMQICIQFLGETDATMTIVDISMMTGFSPDMEDLKKLTNHVDKYISKFEINDVLSDTGSLILYLDKVSHTEHECLKFKTHQYFEVGLIQPGTVTVYEYYATENRCTKFYHPTKDGGFLSTLCQKNTCRCMEEKCSMIKKFTPKPDSSVRIEAACQPSVDYVYKAHLKTIESKGMYNYYTMKIVQVIKEGTEQAVQGKERQFISPLLCQETLNMQLNGEYLIWGSHDDMWDLKDEMAYLLTSNSWIELWPTPQECQQEDLALFCQGLQDFSQHMERTGCVH